jgi:hypothetical protein
MAPINDLFKSVTSRDWWAAFLLRWRGAIVTVALILLLVVEVWHFTPDIGKAVSADGKRIAIAFVVLFIVFGFLLTITFFGCFRGSKADEQTLNAIISYCYAFIIFSLTASILPFFALPQIPGLYDAMVRSPVGIVAGCASEVDSEEKSVPKELRCDTKTDQWLVNIGGTTVLNGEATPMATADGNATGLPTVSIRGGLVVPLYVVVLALMGAAVSMTRRVPEYQRRLSPGDPEYISYDRAREALVFQIMQVLSAPLIAVTAYYLVDPGSRSSTIVLAFISGFSSETVLLFIRALMEKVKPAGLAEPTAPPAIAVAPARLEFGDVAANSTLTKSVAISNPRAAPLTVSDLTCTGEFAIVTSPTKFTIAPGASRSVEVEFKPTSAGSKQGELIITDDAPGAPRTVDLTGQGVE